MYAVPSSLIECLKSDTYALKAKIRDEKNKIKMIRRLRSQKKRLQANLERVTTRALNCANELAYSEDKPVYR
jgi:hypothetical protein